MARILMFPLTLLSDPNSPIPLKWIGKQRDLAEDFLSAVKSLNSHEEKLERAMQFCHGFLTSILTESLPKDSIGSVVEQAIVYLMIHADGTGWRRPQDLRNAILKPILYYNRVVLTHGSAFGFALDLSYKPFKPPSDKATPEITVQETASEE